MKKKILDYFEVSTVQMCLFMVVIVVKQVSKCVYLSCMGVKIKRTADDHNHDILQQCISEVYVSQVWGLNQS